MPETLTVSIVPDDGGVTFDALYRAVEDLRRLVLDVDGAVTQRPGRQRARRWYVDHITSSNPAITLRPATDGTDSGDRTVKAIVGGVKWISAGQQDAPPPYFSERELEDLREIKRLRANGVSRLEFRSDGQSDSPASLVPSLIEEQVSLILRSGDAEYGSLEGILDALNLHRTRTLTIWEGITGLAVRASFPEEFENTVREMLRHRVRITGLVNYFADGRPRRITEFTSIEDMQLASGSRATFGSIPDLTGGRGAIEHLRIVRAE